jgi:putative flippase GtrA
MIDLSRRSVDADTAWEWGCRKVKALIFPVPLGQITRFVASGGAVAALYMATTATLLAIGTRAQLALVIGYALGLVLHFTLNRHFVFMPSRGFAHRVSAQGVRYLAVAAGGYAVTAAALATLPGRLSTPSVVVFVVVTVAITVVNFVILRSWVFRPAAKED